MCTRKISRRSFLSGTAAAAAFAIVSRHALGAAGEVRGRAVIGTGNKGSQHVTPYPGTLAVCDVDLEHLAHGLKNAGGKCQGYSDWRRVLDRKDIDVVHVCTPPHWHALIAIAAIQSGRDVYLEKPSTHTIPEGRALIEAVNRYGRVCQVNCMPRSGGRSLRKVVDHGLLGSPLTVVAGGWGGWTGQRNLVPQPVPAQLDYNMWLGPAPFKPYHPDRVHEKFRGYWDYEYGVLGDGGQHRLCPLLYGLAKEDTGPVEVEAVAPWPQHSDAVGPWSSITWKYADGTTITFTDQGVPYSVTGPKGKFFPPDLVHGGPPTTDPPELRDELARLPDPPTLTSFDSALRTRDNENPDNPNPQQALASATLIHLGALAVRLGRKLRWDPVKEQFIGDEEASRLLNPPMRAPWHL